MALQRFARDAARLDDAAIERVELRSCGVFELTIDVEEQVTERAHGCTSSERGQALTRGGTYRNTPNDSQVPYLKTIFAFLGMTDMQFVYAEGLAMGPEAEQQALASAHAQIEEVLSA